MKHFITTILFLATFITGYSQITLEHNLTTTWLETFTTDSYGLMFCEKYIKSGINSFNIYNSDYSLYKKIELKIPTGSMAGIYCYSDKLFNNDNLLEFICVFTDTSSSTLAIYNENGNIIYSFPKTYTSLNSPTVIKINNSYKLILNYYKDNNCIYEMYSLPGSLPNKVSELQISDIQSAFPNPSKTIINLPYSLEEGQTTTLKIYKTNGQLLEQKQIDSAFDKIQLNVNSYQPGTYVYEYNGVSKKFIVN